MVEQLNSVGETVTVKQWNSVGGTVISGKVWWKSETVMVEK